MGWFELSAQRLAGGLGWFEFVGSGGPEEKAQLALMRLGVAAGDRTFVETVIQSLIITL